MPGETPRNALGDMRILGELAVRYDLEFDEAKAFLKWIVRGHADLGERGELGLQMVKGLTIYAKANRLGTDPQKKLPDDPAVLQRVRERHPRDPENPSTKPKPKDMPPVGSVRSSPVGTET